MNISIALTLCAVGMFDYYYNQVDTNRIRCIDNYIKANMKDSICKVIMRDFNDTLQSWINNKIRTVQGYKDNKWKIDAVLFDSNNYRGFLILLKIDSDSNATFDNIKFIAFQRENTNWNYYSAGFITIAMNRGFNDGVPYSMEQLSAQVRQYLLEGDFVNDMCEVNSDFFRTNFKNDVKEPHQWFLNDKIKDD